MSPRGVGQFRNAAAHAHFLDAYRRAQDELPPADGTYDLATEFGVVRVYRFDGPAATTPVVLLPGRNASTPMWADLPSLLTRRTVYSVDLLGEPGMSVQQRPLRDAEDQAQWFDDALAGLGLDAVHLMGVSFGGWTAANHAVRRPGRAASLTLLDPVMTFAPIPLRTMLAVAPIALPGAPGWLRRRVLAWLSGGADVDDSVPVAALIAAGSADYVLRQPLPQRFRADELRSLDIPVLALIAGRSVIHDARRAADRARSTLRRGQVELWPAASHALTGEFADEIAVRSHRFWDEVDRLAE